jgi:uncharacterized protein (DUF433 family)
MIEHPVIVRDPEIMSGTPVFAGSRVPVRALIDYISEGHSLDDFLDDFPSVTREHALELLEVLQQQLLAGTDEDPA